MTSSPPLATVTEVLEVDDLHTFFVTRSGLRQKKTVKAVNGVSLNIAKGETLGLVGESGCGKSTLVRTILGLHKATSGTVRLNGQELTSLSRGQRRATSALMQVVFQDPYSSLDPRMTVHEIVAEPLRINRQYSKTRVAQLLDQVGLTREMSGRKAAEFSGGQRQRIGIARALALQPELLILDEPVSALDVSIQAQVINLLQDLQAELGLAYLFIAHDLSVVRHLSHRIAVMYAGQFVEEGDRDQVFDHPKNDYTKALWRRFPSLTPTCAAKTARAESTTTWPPRPLQALPIPRKDNTTAMFKHNVRRKAAVAVVAAAAIFALAACSSSGSGGSSGSSTSLGSITVGQTADVQSLDPVIDNSLQGINVYDTLYDTLTQLKRNGDVIPRLATSWTSNSNATEWDVKLTHKAKFSNGDPVTAADVIFTYQQVQTNPKSLNASYLSSVKTMTAVGKYEVKFELSTPFANWPRQMTLLSIVPEKVYKADGGSAGFVKHPIGSGPYTFVSYKSGVSLVVKRNPNYWGPKATLGQITFVPVLTDQSRVSGVQSGSLDLALIPPTSVDTLKGSGAVDVRNVGGNQTMYLGFNASSGETANAKIREAISLSVDRPAIVKSILGGLGIPANQLSSPKKLRI
ncbi:MAG: ABC transporter substrate-binding protein [Galbitalea sp.]